MSVRLEWEGKPTQVERLSLPFQTVEAINESRATRDRDEGSLLAGGGPSSDGWRNQLIWGDNKLVMSSLLGNYAGTVKLVYIDPPFATGSDFELRFKIGDHSVTKEPSILEEHAYRDTWGAGYESYLSMMYPRLVLIRELLSEDGTIFVHIDRRLGAQVKLMLDEIFGEDHLINEIVWCYTGPSSPGMRSFANKHDLIYWYGRGSSWTFNVDELRLPYAESTRRNEGRRTGWTTGNPDAVVELNPLGKYPEDWWQIPVEAPASPERTPFPTQKPRRLLERIIKAASNQEDLVGDFFVGSGTTAAVAEKLGRRWIACDIGRFAIHTTRKRLLNISDCRPFEIKNLGAYERQRWRQDTANGALRGYLDTILAFYRADLVEGFLHLHGRKANRMVHVGATDAPVTIDEAEEVMDELADNGLESCDLLGWEWEMGFHDTIGERARRRGLDVRALQIPREVMERRVQEADAVRFFQLAYVDFDIRREGREACVVLKDFAIESEDLIAADVRQHITSWSDLIDYWAVDFDHRNGVFHNQWQGYRTRTEPKLVTQTDWHEYPEPSNYPIVVKIVDIFGNDTTKVAEVTIR